MARYILRGQVSLAQALHHYLVQLLKVLIKTARFYWLHVDMIIIFVHKQARFI